MNPSQPSELAPPTPKPLATARLARDLTPREMEILRLVAEGRHDKEIGDKIGISWRTVNAHKTKFYPKLGAHSKAEAATAFQQLQAGQ